MSSRRMSSTSIGIELVVVIEQRRIERFGLSCRLQILGELPAFKDRLDLGDERRNLGRVIG